MPLARPSRTHSAAIRMDARRFFRMGVMEGSSKRTTSSASTTPTRLPLYAVLWSPDSISRRRPTRSVSRPKSTAAATAPSTLTRGAWSPPMASTAIVKSGLLGSAHDFPALVVTAGRAHPVRQLLRAAIRAGRGLLGLQEIVGAAQVAARLAVAVLWIRHGGLL